VDQGREHWQEGQTIKGWTLSDNAGHVYKFSSFKLKAGGL
jgi:hypothetical protein